MVAQHDRRRPAEDHPAVGVDGPADRPLGAPQDLAVGQQRRPQVARVDHPLGRQRGGRGEQAGHPAAHLLVAAQDLVDGDAEVVRDDDRDRPVHEGDAQALGDRRADETAAGPVRGRDRDHMHRPAPARAVVHRLGHGPGHRESEVAGGCSSCRNRRRRSPPYISAILSDVDPFIGTAATDLPPPDGLAATWWWPKPQVGNTHPGATSPLGMVSACAYSGAYPTGYGRYGKNTEGVPEEMFAQLQASGLHPLPAVRHRRDPQVLQLRPGHPDDPAAGRARASRGRCTTRRPSPATTPPPWTPACAARSPSARRSPCTGTRSRSSRSARVVVDLSCGGLAIDHGRTVPLRAQVESMGHGHAQGTIVVEGVPLSVHLEVRQPRLAADALVRPAADRRAGPGWTSTASGRPRCGRSACCSWARPRPARRSRCGWASRCAACEQARENLRRECGRREPAFDVVAVAHRGPVGRRTSTASRSRAARRPGAR